jgi:hypothetical protein
MTTLSRTGPASAKNPEGFAFGLDLILDRLERMLPPS